MATQHNQIYCRYCRAYAPAVRQGVNHVLHLLLTVICCLWWLPIWLLLALFPNPWRCTRCGSVEKRPMGWIAAMFVAVVIMAGGFIVTLVLALMAIGE